MGDRLVPRLSRIGLALALVALVVAGVLQALRFHPSLTGSAWSGAPLSFAVTREMFDFTETVWEPPTDEEMSRHNGVWVVS